MLIPESVIGALSVLNVGAGDLEFKFDKDNPQEVVRAKRVIEDMLRRGYALFVEVGGKLTPVKKFDAEREVYIIADGPLYAGDQPEVVTPVEPVAEPKRRGRPRKTREVPMRTTKATGVAPTAGG